MARHHRGVPMERVFVAADEAQAESVQMALIEAGILATIAVEPANGGGMVLEVRVPLDDFQKAVEIVNEGNWPRLA